MKQVHFLNGDALLYQFPESIPGERLVMRECLIEGPVNGRSLDSFYRDRLEFLQFEYGATEEAYMTKTISEFEKLAELPGDHEINLWFEQDLFCQTNLWFISYFLNLHKKKNPTYLIMPQEFSSYGFAALDSKELLGLYKERKPLVHIKEFAAIWEYYRSGEDDRLWQTALDLNKIYPFMAETVKAHLERRVTETSLGRPINSLIDIIKELDTTDFSSVFKEFSLREGVYGFGDLQVKRLYDQIISQELHL